MVHLMELFSGSGSVGNVARKLGWKVSSLDLDPASKATYEVDILKWDYKSVPIPDIVWASPPCETYSIAATRWAHRSPKTGQAWSDNAVTADRVLSRLMLILRYWLKKKPTMRYVIENPHGYMRLMPQLRGLHYTTTSYNQFGWPIRKPTDFWSNVPLDLPPVRSNPSLGKESLLVGRHNDRIFKAFGARSRNSKKKSSAKHPITRVTHMVPPRLVQRILTQLSSARP